MARCWSHELRWWFVVVSICGWSFLVTANLSSSFISRRNPRIPSGLEIMIFLREQCDHDSGLLEIQQLINNYSTGAAISVIPKSRKRVKNHRWQISLNAKFNRLHSSGWTLIAWLFPREFVDYGYVNQCK